MSSNGQEDHVSMGANAMLKLIRIVENVRKVLAIELFTACQALEFRDITKSSSASQKLIKTVREKIPFIKEDIEMAGFMKLSEEILDSEV